MSRTYSIACKQCKTSLWIGQAGSGNPRGYIYDRSIPDLVKFLWDHLDHPLEFCNALHLIDYKEIEMDNQHRQIKGYRELNADEIALMNEIKAVGPVLEALVNKLYNTPDIDPRWVNIGKTDLQTGLMALTRSVARPEFF